MNKTELFLNSIDEVWRKPVPSDVMARARYAFLDYLCVTCAGAAFQREKLRGYFSFIPPETGRFKVIGTQRDVALKDAVFLNGLNSHALDYDDGTNSGIIHLGSPIFSLLVPLAQLCGITIDDLLSAAIVGYEASYTMAASIQPRHKEMGFHATGTCGTLGATIAASYMLGFSEYERFQAFAAACVAASGMLKALDDESELKPYNVAKTALLSLTAIQMSKSGFKGHHDPLGGRGFLKMMFGDEGVELSPALLDGTYAVSKAYIKPYASCRYTHPAVEAAIKARSQLPEGDVTEIEVRTYPLAVDGHDLREVPNCYAAKMSIPFATAAGILFGKAGLHEFSEEVVHNSQVIDLARKVQVIADDELGALFPTAQAAIVSLSTNDARVCCRVDYPKGEPQNPLTSGEFRARYDDLMSYAGIPRAAQNSVFDMVHSGEALVDDVANRIAGNALDK